MEYPKYTTVENIENSVSPKVVDRHQTVAAARKSLTIWKMQMVAGGAEILSDNREVVMVQKDGQKVMRLVGLATEAFDKRLF